LPDDSPVTARKNRRCLATGRNICRIPYLADSDLVRHLDRQAAACNSQRHDRATTENGAA